MKIVLKILGILIAILIILMVAVPYFFSDQIAEKVKEEINKNVNARVDFADFNLSLFRSFPDFNFRLEGLSVANKAPFENDTLAYVPAMSLTLDLMSVFKGEAYELKKLHFDQPVIDLLVTEDGTANWDIALPSEPAEEETAAATESSDFLIRLNSVTVDNARIIYNDKSLATYVLLEDVNHRLSGDFTLDFTTLKTYTTVGALTVEYEGIKYLKRVDAELDAEIDADLNNYIYTLKDNELRLNELFIVFDGSVAMQENDDINLMLTYSSKRSKFKNFLSMVPAIYASNFENIQTSGDMTLNGNVKGIYNSENYPGFELNILVDNGRFQYPDLPKSVEAIEVNAQVSFPGGDLDRLVVRVSKFNFTMAGNPVSAKLTVKTPISDPDLKGEVNGKINLGQIKEVYPLEESDELSGIITSNVSFEGKMSTIEQGAYEAFTLFGSLLVQNLNYQSDMLAVPLAISKAQLNFSPEYLDLVSYNMNLGESDFSANGRIENFLPYLLDDGVMSGQLSTSSTMFNISSLLPDETDETINEPAEATDDGQPADTDPMETVKIPEKIDFTLTSTFDKLLYDDIELRNVNGKLILRDQALTLDQLDMDVLDGSMVLSGTYDTKGSGQPLAEFNLKLKRIDIQQAYNTFGAVEKLAPIAEKTSGRFWVNFDLTTRLMDDLSPDYPTMNGGGSLRTSEITVENVNSLSKIADALQMPDLKRLLLSPVDLSFKISDGKVNVDPFDIKYQDMKATISGWTSLDQDIEYDMKLKVPRKKFGGAANDALQNLVEEANRIGTDFSLGENVSINIKITGTVTDPKIKTVLGKSAGKNIFEDLKKQAEDELKKQKEKFEEKARKELEKKKKELQEKASRIISNAEKRADEIVDEAQKKTAAIKKAARETADKVKQEADKQAQNIIDEAAGKGTLAEIGARKAAEKVRSEADDKAEKIVNEANNRADNLVKEARQQAQKIVEQAQAEADKVLEGN